MRSENVNGEKFKVLKLEQQVEYINELLEQGNTVDNIRGVLGVGKNYISTNFKKGGYIRNRATGLYVKAGTEATINTNTTNEKAQKVNNKALSGCNGGNNSNSLEKRVKDLEKQIEAIKAMLETNNTNTTTATELNIKTFEGEKVARSYKVNKEVQKQFKAFCKAHSEYEVGDILANAMFEFMNKFK